MYCNSSKNKSNKDIMLMVSESDKHYCNTNTSKTILKKVTEVLEEFNRERIKRKCSDIS